MQIPSDMHKWRTKFAWEMVGFAVLSLVMAMAMVASIWFLRARWMINPTKSLIPMAGIALTAAMLVCLSFTCIGISVRTRRQDAKMKEMEKNRPPLTLSKLREELLPGNQEQFRSRTVKMLQSTPSGAREFMGASMRQLVDRYRKDLGSTPEVEAELTRLMALIEEVLRQASATAR